MAAACPKLTGICAKYYKPLNKLGGGTYGDVWMVRHRSTGACFAAKLMKRERWTYIGSAERELTVLYDVNRHDNVVPWYEMLLTGDIFDRGIGHELQALIMELCDMDLTKYLEERQNRGLDSSFDIAQQVMEGMVFLHEHKPKIIHRDIKPGNILVKQNPHTKKHILKLADFGLSNAVEFGDVMENLISKDFVKTMKSMKTTVGGRGTFPFMAPEFFASKEGRGLTDGKFRIDASVDVFALGLVFAYVFGYNSGDFYGTYYVFLYLRVDSKTERFKNKRRCFHTLHNAKRDF